MENKKLNIRRILRKRHKSAWVFYSEHDGDIILSELNSERDNNLMSFVCYGILEKVYFTATGKRYPEDKSLCGVSLYPSRYMNDWRKMLWNKDDLLAHDGPDVQVKRFVFFQSWADNYYTSFIGLEFIKDENFFNLKLKVLYTDEFRRVSHDRAIEILDFMTQKFSNAELEKATTRFVKYQDIFSSLLVKRVPVPFTVSSELKAQENLTRRAVEKINCPVGGCIYYFEDTAVTGLYYIAKLDKISDDKSKVFFSGVVSCCDDINCFNKSISMSTRSCANFRNASETEQKTYNTISEAVETLEGLEVGKRYVYNSQEYGMCIGVLDSVYSDRRTFALLDVYCAKRGCKVKHFDRVVFLLEVATDIRPATESDDYFMEGVKKSYTEQVNKKKNGLRPKDWCLMRNENCDAWNLCQFAIKFFQVFHLLLLAVKCTSIASHTRAMSSY